MEAAYSKKLGLPNYSSHSYVVSIRTELNEITQVPEESTKLYKMLQEAVDREIQAVGFMPDATTYGMNNGNGHSNGHANGSRTNGNGHHVDAGITEKQLDLINRVVKDNNLSKTSIDNLSVEMFGGGVRTLNRMQASNFIDELFERYPKKTNGNGNGSRYQERRMTRV